MIIDTEKNEQLSYDIAAMLIGLESHPVAGGTCTVEDMLEDLGNPVSIEFPPDLAEELREIQSGTTPTFTRVEEEPAELHVDANAHSPSLSWMMHQHLEYQANKLIIDIRRRSFLEQLTSP